MINLTVYTAVTCTYGSRKPTSPMVVLDVLDSNRRTELEAGGGNGLGALRPISLSTRKRVLRRIVPKRVNSGGVQSTSRQRALLDPRNAISCAATWSAVTTGVVVPVRSIPGMSSVWSSMDLERKKSCA